MAENGVEYLGSGVAAPPPINIINFETFRTSQGRSGGSHYEIVEEDEEDVGGFGGFTVMTPITEEYSDCNSSDLFSYDIDRHVNDVVYVVTWKGTEELSSASMDALVWTLRNDLRESTVVYLIHVFPEIHFIPTLLGMLPISQANPEQKEGYLIQERKKRNEYLQKFLSLCSSSKVQVETLLIQSDMEAKAILDLIPILNIRKLVLGATKSTLRKLKGSSKKGGGGTIYQILHNAPEFCDVKIICEGKEVSLQDQFEPPSPTSTTPFPHDDTNVNTLQPLNVQEGYTLCFVKCNCFKL